MIHRGSADIAVCGRECYFLPLEATVNDELVADDDDDEDGIVDGIGKSTIDRGIQNRFEGI